MSMSIIVVAMVIAVMVQCFELCFCSAILAALV